MRQLSRIEINRELLEAEAYSICREDDTITIIQDFGTEIDLSIRQAKELVDILVKELEYKGGEGKERSDEPEPRNET